MLERFLVVVFCFFSFIQGSYASVAPKDDLDIDAKDLFMKPLEYLQDKNKVNKPFVHRNFEVDINRDGLHFNVRFEPGNQEAIDGKALKVMRGTLKNVVDGFLKNHLIEALDLADFTQKRGVKKKQETNNNLIEHDEVVGSEDMAVGILSYIKNPENIAGSALDLVLEEELKESKDEIILNKLKEINNKIILGYKFGQEPKDRNRPFSENVGFSNGEKPWGRVIFSVEKVGDASVSPIKIPELLDIEELSQEITLELGAKLLTYYAHFNNYFLKIKKNLVPYIEFPSTYLSAVSGVSSTPLFSKDNLKIWSDSFGLSIGMLVQPGIQDSIKAQDINGKVIDQPAINNINFKSMDELVLYFIEALKLNYDNLVNGDLNFLDSNGKFVDKSVARAFNDEQVNVFYDGVKAAELWEDTEDHGTTEVFISDGENSAPEIEMDSDLGSFITNEDIINEGSGEDGITSTTTPATIENNHDKNQEIIKKIQLVTEAHNKSAKVKFNEMLDMLKNNLFPPFMMSFNYGYRPEFRDSNHKDYRAFKGRFDYQDKHEIPWGRVVFIISSLGDSQEYEDVDININDEKYMALIISRVLKNFEKMIDENKASIDNKQSDYYI